MQVQAAHILVFALSATAVGSLANQVADKTWIDLLHSPQFVLSALGAIGSTLAGFFLKSPAAPKD